MPQNPVPSDFEKHYSEPRFWKKARAFAAASGRQAIEKALVLYNVLQDPKAPRWAKTVVTGALGYLIFPLDAIPDIIPGAGFTDDLGVLAAAFTTIALCIRKRHRDAARAKVNEWFGEKVTMKKADARETSSTPPR